MSVQASIVLSSFALFQFKTPRHKKTYWVSVSLKTSKG
jgi:hypothetical protein